jgi:hypothetical protein
MVLLRFIYQICEVGGRGGSRQDVSQLPQPPELKQYATLGECLKPAVGRVS